MANTVSGLFPELAGALAANPLADAYKPVSDPLAAYTGLISGTGAQLRQSIGQAFGQQTPQEQLRSIVQSVQQQADLTTPEGLLQLANELNKNPQFSGMALSMRQEAAKVAAERKAAGLKEQLTKSQIVENIAQAEKAARDEKKPTEPKKVGIAADDGQIVYLQDGEQFKLGPGGTKVPYYGSIRKESGDVKVMGPRDIIGLVTQGTTATKDITKNTEAINRALDLNAQNSPFAGAAFKQEVASIFGDAQKAASEIQALANTGSLDVRIANRVTSFLDGSSTNITKQDRDAVLKTLRKRNEDSYERTLAPLRAAIGDDEQALKIFPKFKDRYSISPGIRKGIPIPEARKAQYPEGSKHQGPKGEKYVVRNGELFTEGE